MTYNELRKQYKRERIKSWLTTTVLVVVFFLLPLFLIFVVQPYTEYQRENVKEPGIIKDALKEAKNTDEKEISDNEVVIKSMNNTIDESKKNAWKLENKDAEKLYEETGITYDFGQVHAISEIPSDTKLDRDLLRGQILIPGVGLNLPIVEGVSNENLYIGASTMKPHQQMGHGNYALAGHLMPNEQALFSPLKRVQDGELIYVTNKEQVFIYKVYRIEKIEPTNVQVIDDVPGKNLITLITCSNLDGDGRIVVQGEYIESKNVNEIDQNLYNQFKE